MSRRSVEEASWALLSNQTNKQLNVIEPRIEQEPIVLQFAVSRSYFNPRALKLPVLIYPVHASMRSIERVSPPEPY
jgi:hypothetical protein